ncbi:S-adenosylmethionine:tRNA ribosyltransferase-isomerase [Solirubrobacter sp. CPCC 204708]|uniref:S-adenosylmethionine:tRNA ribosyltransferase-isomerase n=1 Tax=Solirubrobacter deserti TaxID=2282478 RepID=A0ABT4RUM5_9ACTN|nr:S-adenosylmethionine:tRNA ribosyltransferase-isomerase [Solirubrobacter deserti]MBE2317926.1 S-adenosylmethionine:tRNA ribosyltransferase-isomerase [Solirubrobacter deserti]MDA0142286.1 S-adenosylmethionine:tRNA ribosyltransferase-isomerase [Solirubrobacter deserti]
MTALAVAPDHTRLLVSQGERLIHTDFDSLPTHLRAGDLLIVNASATIPAALPARRPDGTAVALHLSTPHPDGYVVEVRRHGQRATARAETLTLPAGGRATLLAPYLSPGRLWVARLELPEPLLEYLHRHGAPIRYAHDTSARPLSDYQTIFATEPGSAEMPSAARPFTKDTLRALRAAGVSVQRITLHTGVSSQERGERPYPERYRVSAHTARRINERRGRVIAVGTTVVRALETVADEDGRVHPGEGWTSLTITPEHRVRVVDGLLTGWHDPDASHLLMLEAIAGADVLRRAYAAGAGYRRHEFGDSHLILRR